MVCCDLCNKKEYEKNLSLVEEFNIWLCLVCIDCYSDEELNEIFSN